MIDVQKEIQRRLNAGECARRQRDRRGSQLAVAVHHIQLQPFAQAAFPAQASAEANILCVALPDENARRLVGAAERRLEDARADGVRARAGVAHRQRILLRQRAGCKVARAGGDVQFATAQGQRAIDFRSAGQGIREACIENAAARAIESEIERSGRCRERTPWQRACECKQGKQKQPEQPASAAGTQENVELHGNAPWSAGSIALD